MPFISSSYYDTFTYKYIPIGFVFPFGSYSFPLGFVECNGAVLPKSSYEKLYSAIGNMYGGVSGVSCMLPDYRNYYIRGLSGLSNNDPDKNTRTDRGDTIGGNVVGSKQLNAIKSHNHLIYYWWARYHTGTQYPGDTRPVTTSDITGTSFNVNSVTANNVGGATKTEPKNVTMVYLIRVI